MSKAMNITKDMYLNECSLFNLCLDQAQESSKNQRQEMIDSLVILKAHLMYRKYMSVTLCNDPALYSQVSELYTRFEQVLTSIEEYLTKEEESKEEEVVPAQPSSSKPVSEIDRHWDVPNEEHWNVEVPYSIKVNGKTIKIEDPRDYANITMEDL